MARVKTKFDKFISDPKRRQIYERESLAFNAAELISDLMEEQAVSKSELAGKVGVTKSHITQLLGGSRNMTMHSLADLAFALGCKVELKTTPLGDLAFSEDARRARSSAPRKLGTTSPLERPARVLATK
jgi:transcriptional regulator with XRE-family HTH domain